MFRARIPVHPGEINAAGCPQGSDAPTVEITGPDAGQHNFLTAAGHGIVTGARLGALR